LSFIPTIINILWTKNLSLNQNKMLITCTKFHLYAKPKWGLALLSTDNEQVSDI